MTKVTLNDVASFVNDASSVSTVNANTAVIETAFDNTLSRDGSVPNQMEAVLDMNSHRIINLPAADTADQPATKAQLDAIGNGYLGNNTLLGTTHEISISSGAGTSTFSLPSSLTLTGKTVTGGDLRVGSTGAKVIINAEDYGAGTGVSDNGTFINLAIAAAAAQGGGFVNLGYGIHMYSTTIVLQTNVTLRGVGDTGTGLNATVLYYTGTTNGISMDGISGARLEDMNIQNTNAAFTGFLVSAVGAGGAYNGINRCTLQGLTGCKGLSLDQTQVFSCNRVTFSGFTLAVKGKASNASYAVVVSFRDCTFLNGFGSNYVQGMDYNWLFDSCVFEANNAATACGFASDAAGNTFRALTISSCWFGDVTSAGGEWLDISGTSLTFIGNSVTSLSNSLNVFGLVLNGVDTAVVKGNQFVNLRTAIAFIGTGNNKIDMVPNYFSGNTNNTTGTIPGSSQYHYLPNSLLMQYGSASVTIGTPLSVTFPTAFSATPLNIQTSVKDLTGAANSITITTVSSTAFTISATGVAGTETVYWTAIGAS